MRNVDLVISKREPSVCLVLVSHVKTQECALGGAWPGAPGDFLVTNEETTGGTGGS